MNDLKEILGEKKVRKVMLIFAHPDDESFVTGGLLLNCEDYGVKSHLVCLTKGGLGKNSLSKGDVDILREDELHKASKILGIDKLTLMGYPDAGLRKTKSKWTKEIRKLIKDEKPDVVITFDYSGITGHPDHIISCDEVRKIVSKMKNPPILLWRVPDENEKKHFASNEALIYAGNPTHICTYTLKKSKKKLSAIFAHASQMSSFWFKIHLVEELLFHTQESYHVVDLKRKYKFKFVDFDVD